MGDTTKNQNKIIKFKITVIFITNKPIKLLSNKKVNSKTSNFT